MSYHPNQDSEQQERAIIQDIFDMYNYNMVPDEE